MSENMASAIDHDTLNRLKADMGDDFDELIPVFIESAREILTALEQAFKENNIEAFARHAHSLKSSCANLGGLGLAKMAAELESQANAGSLPDSVDFIQPLNSNFDQIEVALSNFPT